MMTSNEVKMSEELSPSQHDRRMIEGCEASATQYDTVLVYVYLGVFDGLCGPRRIIFGLHESHQLDTFATNDSY